MTKQVAEEVDTRSHYAKYTEAHKKYEQSEKGKRARQKYMSSAKGKAARKKYQTKRNAEIKELLKAAREAGADARAD
jgi:hypothetical protein